MALRTLPEIVTILRSAMPLLVEDYAVSEIGVFGSVVRGDAKLESDIDILVDYMEPPTLFEFVRLQRHLSDLLGAPVDLVMKSALKPQIGRQVLAEVVSV